jgi:hypothetical protein
MAAQMSPVQPQPIREPPRRKRLRLFALLVVLLRSACWRSPPPSSTAAAKAAVDQVKKKSAAAPNLLHRRNRELHAFLDAGRPTRGDGFSLGIRGQRLSLGRDRGEAQGARLAQSHSSACEPQSYAIESTGERQPPEEQGSGSRRARVRCSANIAGWSDCTDDRYRAGESQDRSAEPRL